MLLDDEIYMDLVENGFDEQMNPVETNKRIYLGKCKILPNDRAQFIVTNDSTAYQYSYVVFMRRNKMYDLPIQGTSIHLTKKDKSINKDFIVASFVTLKQYVKLWV